MIEFERLANEGSSRALTEAAALYRGSLLKDLSVNAEEWADWLAGERQRLQDIAVDVLVRLAEIEMKVGHTADALSAAKRAIALDGFREDAHRIAIASAAASGLRAQAIRLYEELRDFLDKELDVEPDDDVKNLVEGLRRADTSHSGDSPPAPQTVRQPGQSAPSISIEAAQAILAVEHPPEQTQSAAPGLGTLQSAIRAAAGERGRLVERRGDILLFHFTEGSEAAASVDCCVRLGRSFRPGPRTDAGSLAPAPRPTVSKYLSSHPAAEFGTGRMWANALRKAGLPE